MGWGAGFRLWLAVVEKPLSAQRLDERGRHGLVVLARVADVGEYLGEGLHIVDFHEVAVLLGGFLLGIGGVDAFGRIVGVGLLVHDGAQRQTVGLRRMLVGPTQSDGGDGEYQRGQLQGVDDGLGAVDGGTQEAEPQPLGLCHVAEGLAVEQCVGGGIDETQQKI